MTSTLETLRLRTRELHLALEARLDLERLLGSRPEYTRLLLGYLAIYRPLERALTAQASTLSQRGWIPLARTPLIEQDLRMLGWNDEQLCSARECQTLPALADCDALLGALYVVEGSSLGGQLLYRQVAERLALDSASGASFFYGAGPDTGAGWKRFAASLEAGVANPEQAAASACAMFRTFEQELVAATACCTATAANPQAPDRAPQPAPRHSNAGSPAPVQIELPLA